MNSTQKSCSLRFPRGRPLKRYIEYRRSLDQWSYATVLAALRRVKLFSCFELDRMLEKVMIGRGIELYVIPIQLETKGNGVLSYAFFLLDESDDALVFLDFCELFYHDVFGLAIRGIDPAWVFRVNHESPKMIMLAFKKCEDSLLITLHEQMR